MSPHQRQRLRHILALWVVLLCSTARGAIEFADDLDTNTAKWDRINSGGSATAGINTSTKRRGAAAYSVAETSATTGLMGQLATSLPPASPTVHVRLWMARTGTSNTSTGQRFNFLMVRTSAMTEATDLAAVGQQSSGFILAVRLGGRGVSTVTTHGDGILTIGNWHLYELRISGIGTASGERTLFFDGAQIATQSVDFSGVQPSEVAVGLTVVNGGDYSVAIDDVRISATAMASKLVIAPTSPGPFGVGPCVPANVQLVSSSGGAAAAPYAFGAVLADTGAAGSFFSNAACTTATSTAAFATGATTSSTVYFKATAAGDSTWSATYPDFISQDATVTFATVTHALAFTSSIPAQTTGGCAAITLERRDLLGNPANGAPTAVNLASTSAGASFYSTPDCSSTPIAGVTLPSGSPQATFYLRDTGTGSFTLTASAPNHSSATASYSVARANGAMCTTAADCNSGICAQSVCCDRACTGGACETCSAAEGASANGVCTFLPVTMLCRSGAGLCDPPEHCTGNSATCPADALADATVECRAATTVCDLPEKCTGLATTCPPDLFAPITTLCRTPAGPCDAEESCTGLSSVCPADGFTTGGVCRAVATVCDRAETCDGSGPGCPADVFATGGVCRAAVSVCDSPESCDGTGPGCPVDGFAPATQLCRATSGDCDAADHCTGATPICPADAKRPDQTLCTGGVCGEGLCRSLAPEIVREANLHAAVGRPYLYSSLAAVRAYGQAPMGFTLCDTPVAGMTLDVHSGALAWTPAAAGSMPVCVSATNALGVDTYRFAVQVLAQIDPPQARFTVAPGSGTAPLPVRFDASASSFASGTSASRHRWSFGDGAVLTAGVAATSTHDYPAPGGYTVRLEVTDLHGGVGEAIGHVAVLDSLGKRPPRAKIVSTSLTGAEELTVELSCDCQAGDEPLQSYRWSFGDGRTAAGPTARATFNPGRYQVRLLVIDGAGLSASDEVTVTVTRGGKVPPRCEARAEPPAGRVPFTSTLHGSYLAGDAEVTSAKWELAGRAASGLEQEHTFLDPGFYPVRFQVDDASGLSCRRELELIALRADGTAPERELHQTSISCRVRSQLFAPAQTAAPGVTWSLRQAPEGVSVDESSGQVSWLPSPAQGGTHLIVLRGLEPGGGEQTKSLEVEVECIDAAFATGCGCGSGVGALGLLGALVLLPLSRRRLG
jgi:PKD repeat protein